MSNLHKNLAIGAGFGVLALAVWAVAKARPGQSAMSSLAEGLGAAVGGAVVDGITGTVKGVYGALPDAVKPSSDQNIIYRLANENWRWIGILDENETIGTKIYDWLH